jgi:hypothetical protein
MITHRGGVVRDGPIISRGSVTVGPSGRGLARLLFAVLLLFSLYWALYTFRQALADALPATYPLLRALGLEVDEPAGYGFAVERVRTLSTTDEYNQPVVLVRGTLANTSAERRMPPRLRIAVTRRGGEQVATWSQTLAQPSLAPGQRVLFEARHPMRAPARDLSVRVVFERR